MTGRGHTALDRLDQSLSKRNCEYDLPDSLLSSSDADDKAPTPVKHRRPTIKAKKDNAFPHLRKHTLTGTVNAHTQIYVVNEQIIHNKTTWSVTLGAFDSLHSANTDARTRAVFQHANGDASLVQVQYRNGYGMWTTVLETPRGRIAKSVFVNATVLQCLVAPPATLDVVHQPLEPGDRLVPSSVPGSRRVRQIQAFRSTDSIRGEVVQSGGAVKDTRRMHGCQVEDVLREHPAQRNRMMGNAWATEDEMKQGQGVQAGKENVVPKRGSIEDLKEFASLHTLL